MDQATLVNVDVSAGQKVLDALDHAGVKVTVALWIVSSDYDDWRLILSSPSLDQDDLLKAHEQLAEALHDPFVYMRAPILILPTKDPLIRDLRRMFGKAKDVNGMLLGGQTLGKKFISDAYVYRIQ